MIRVIHNKCGKIAFHFKERLSRGDIFTCNNVVKLNGRSPSPGDIPICGSCGEPFSALPENITQQHWSDWFLLKEDKWKLNK